MRARELSPEGVERIVREIFEGIDELSRAYLRMVLPASEAVQAFRSFGEAAGRLRVAGNEPQSSPKR